MSDKNSKFSKPISQGLVSEPVHPLRFCIGRGKPVADRIPELKAFIAGEDFDAGLKAFILAKLDGLPGNAAEISLHEVERPAGGFDLHLSIVPRDLGGGADAVFRRPAPAKNSPAG